MPRSGLQVLISNDLERSSFDRRPNQEAVNRRPS